MSRYAIGHPGSLDMAAVLAAVRALAEDTRLRILTLLAQGELSVSDLTEILGQSQPRISRHLKLLVDSGLVDRAREGAWAFFRVAETEAVERVLAPVLAALDPQDPRLLADRDRLARVRAERSRAAEEFFAGLAPRWDNVRSLHVSEEAVEAAILKAVGGERIDALVDLGTGTGRMLQLVAPQARRAVGLDLSRAMREVARANLERVGLSRVELRQGDIYQPPLARGSFDLVIVHQVLHYLDDPARAIASAAQLVAPGGRLLIVDFAPHGLEFLRAEEGHRRLGFSAAQISAWLVEAGLDPVLSRDLTPPDDKPEGLTVSLWLASNPKPPGRERPGATETSLRRTPEIA